MAVMSDLATIPLQDFLCNKMLESNTTVVMDYGEYHISSGPPCDISNEGNVTITGSSMKSTTVHCKGEGRVFRFSSVQRVHMERMTFINCVYIWNQSKILSSLTAHSVHAKEAISSSKSYNDNGAVRLYGSTGDVSITNCTFRNSATFGGSAVWLDGSRGITNCIFQNNSTTSFCGGAVMLPAWINTLC